jgi:two-component system chemotaxis sensor kinase CheA
MSSDSLIADFLAESAELLEGLDAELQEVLSTGETAPLHKVFRAVHTVKGTAGFLGLLNVKNFAHEIEDILDRLRSNQLPLTPDLQRELTHCLDLLNEQIPRAAANPPTHELTVDEIAAGKQLAEAAGTAVVDDRSVLRKLAAFVHAPVGADVDLWLGQLRDMLAPWSAAQDASSALGAPDGDWLSQAAASRFELASVDVTELTLPLFELFRASREARLTDAITEEFLAAIDVLARRGAALGADDVSKRLEATASECRIIHESPIDLDELLVSNLEDQLRETLTPLMRAQPKSAPPATAVLEASPPAAKSEAKTSDAPSKALATVRVREDLLDRFIWHVGETYLALELYRDLQNRLSDTGAPANLLSEFTELNRELTVAVGKLQQSAMDIRRVPIATLFNKVPSMVRQLAPQLGKQVEVEISGGDNRIDKSLLQELEGPMTHLIRNALDHGLDTPQEREARGREPTGRLRLSCRTDRESIVIEIEDDGRGIDPSKVRAKAIERGIITAAQAGAFSPDEIYQLLCRPGFSTAEKISDVSGRGVGLDVVSSAVSKNRGKLTIKSQLGVGTQFSMAFPVNSTVLMVDGLLCSSGNRHAAFGVEYVSEVVRLTPEMLRTVAGAPVAVVRGQTYPVYSLQDAFGAVNGDTSAHTESGEHGVVLQHLHQRALLRVDRLLGYRKLVLKGIDRTLVRCSLLSGVAQLGGAKLALVFDVPELLQFLESGLTPSTPRPRPLQNR